ncbi:MAG TPA: hypothetical protein VHE35_29435 [Kofleriaceae bacterium]|nr:hypothetical protein [Kofleriaceae bacterium]
MTMTVAVVAMIVVAMIVAAVIAVAVIVVAAAAVEVSLLLLAIDAFAEGVAAREIGSDLRRVDSHRLQHGRVLCRCVADQHPTGRRRVDAAIIGSSRLRAGAEGDQRPDVQARPQHNLELRHVCPPEEHVVGPVCPR